MPVRFQRLQAFPLYPLVKKRLWLYIKVFSLFGLTGARNLVQYQISSHFVTAYGPRYKDHAKCRDQVSLQRGFLYEIDRFRNLL